MKVRYFAPFYQKTGYAQAAHDYAMALHRAGVDLCLRPILDADPSWLPERYAELIPLTNREDADYPDWPDVIIVHSIPAGLTTFIEDELTPPEHVKRVFLTTWESSKLVKEYADDIINNADSVWVPSNYNKDALVASGVPEKHIRVVPHTFDPNHWWPEGLDVEKEYEPYTFYSVLTWCARKAPIELLKAYLTEFTEKDNVLLKIKTPGFNTKEVDELARGLGLSYYPPVDMLTEHFSEDEMLGLHYESNCYVTCARAEGWGLGAFEALLVGNPVIATDYSGLKDFLDGRFNVEKIPVFMTPAYVPETLSNSTMEVAGIKIRAINRNTHTGIRGDQSWAEPDLGTLKKLMRSAYEEKWNPTAANKESLTRDYSYTSVGNKMKSLLEELVGK